MVEIQPKYSTSPATHGYTYLGTRPNPQMGLGDVTAFTYQHGVSPVQAPCPTSIHPQRCGVPVSSGQLCDPHSSSVTKHMRHHEKTSSSSSKFYFQHNTTMEQYQQQHFVDISKHIGTLLHLPVVTREATWLIKLATKTSVQLQEHLRSHKDLSLGD